jgi:hypothetical protein
MHITTSQLLGSALLLAASMTGCSSPTSEGEAPPARQSSAIAGARAWATSFGGVDAFAGLAVQPDGHASILATSNSDIVVARFSPKGQLLWSKRFGDSNYQQATGIAVDASGGVVITGDYWGALDFGGGALPCPGSPGSPRAFVAKLSRDGGHVWSRCFGDTSQQQLGGLALGAGGDVFVTGYFYGSIDLGNGPVTSNETSDQFVARLDGRRGTAVWSTVYDAGSGGLGKLAVDVAGNVFVAGTFVDALTRSGAPLLTASGFNHYALKLDSQGAPQWAKNLGTGESQTEWRLATDGAGNLVAAGSFIGTVDFGAGPVTSPDGDVFVVSLDAQGAHRWSRTFGGQGFDWGFDVATDSDGNVLVTGSFSESIDFGAGPLVSAGGDDIFVAKLDNAGQALWSRGFGDSNTYQAGFRVAAASSGDAILWARPLGALDFGTGPVPAYGFSESVLARISAE